MIGMSIGKQRHRALGSAVLKSGLAIAVVALGVGGSRAADEEPATTGRTLLQLCRGNSADAKWCDGYLTGAVEGMLGSRGFSAKCFRDKPQLGDMKKLIVDFVEWSNLEGDD